MSLTLAIDTSTDVRVGLAADGAVLASSAVTDPRAHAEQLMPLIERTLADAMRNRPQWAPEDLERYRNAATATEPLEPNRIKPLDDPYDDHDPART